VRLDCICKTIFNSGPINVVFVLDKMTLGQVFLRVIRIPPSPSDLYHQRSTVLASFIHLYQKEDIEKPKNFKLKKNLL
jgi:hypothetical protein